MCAISTMFASPGARPPARTNLGAMIHQLHRRGTDGYDFRADGPAGLPHSRLSIIDRATDDQPSRNEDGSVWVILVPETGLTHPDCALS